MEKPGKQIRQLETVYLENRESLLTRAGRITRNALDAEDALQEAFADAFSRLDLMESVENFSAWIFAVLRNRLLDLWRSKKRHAAAGEVTAEDFTNGAANAAFTQAFGR